MGILDDAIKEHLELKRQHGADASELKQLEDEAFGAAERPGDEGASPDPLAEAPTEFMQRPEGLDTEGEGEAAEVEAALEAEVAPGTGDEPMRASRTELADLQEPPPAPEADESAAEPEESAAEEEEKGPAEEEEEEQGPAEEESPAIEHEAVPEPAPEPDPEPSSSHTTAEREAIAEHPTEMYDVEAELGPGEPRVEEVPVEEDPEDFFDEQRLSDELDQALEAPAEEDELAEDEYDEEPEGDDEELAAESGDEGPEAYQPDEGEEDVLEETPDFLEEAPEDDRLWFEQKPPKDFDFDD